MKVVDVVVASLLYLLLLGTGGMRANKPKQPVHGVRQGRQKSSVSSHVGLCEALQYPCLIGTVLPHPTDCQLYLQCVFPGVGQVGVSNNWIVRACSQGTMFDRHQLFCVLPSGVECAETCKNNGTIPGLPGKDITNDPKVEQKPPPPKPQGKTLNKRVIPEGEQPAAERPSIPLAETLYLPEKLKSELLPQDYSTIGKTHGDTQGRRAAQRGEAVQGGGAAQYGIGAAQNEEPHSGYRPDTEYPVYRSNDRSKDSRGPREALGQQGHSEGHYHPLRPTHHSHQTVGGTRLGQERVEPRKGRFPEYRASDYETDDHRGAWKQELGRPEYIPRTEDGETIHPDALTDRLKSGGHYLDHRGSQDSETYLPMGMGGSLKQSGPIKPRAGRDAQRRPKFGSSAKIQQGAAQRTKVRGVDAKQAPDNDGGSPEQFWWDALNLLYSQEVRDNGKGRQDRLKDEREPGQNGQNAPKSRNWRRKNQKASNWNNREDLSPPSLSRNRKEPTPRNWEAPRDMVDPTFENLNRDKPSMRNFKNSGDTARRGMNRESLPARKKERVDLPWRTREMPQIFLAQTTVPVPQSQSQFPVRLAIPTPLPIPEPSTLGARLAQTKTTTYSSRARDTGRSSKFPLGYRPKSRDVTKSAKPEKTPYDQRRSATTRSVFGDYMAKPEATTEAPSTIMPWGTFYKLLRKYALGSDSTLGPDVGTSGQGPPTPATGNGQRGKKGSKAGMSEPKERGADLPDHVTTPRSPYMGIGRNYRLPHSSSESTHGETKDNQDSIRHGDRGGLPAHRDNDKKIHSGRGQSERPDKSPMASGARAGEKAFIPKGHHMTVTLPKGKGIDPSDISGKAIPGVPKPSSNLPKGQGIYSQQQRSKPPSGEGGTSAEEYSIEEPPGGELGTSSEELLRSIEGMFPDLDLSDLDPVELERFLNRQISSAEMVDMTDTTDTTSTTEMVTTTKVSNSAATAAAVKLSGTRLGTSEGPSPSQQPTSFLQQPKPSTKQSKSPTQQPKLPSTQNKPPSRESKSSSKQYKPPSKQLIPPSSRSKQSPKQPKPSTSQAKSPSEQPKSRSEQPRTVRIPLSSLTDRLLQQRFTDPSSQSSAAEAAGRVKALYRFLQHRLRLQGYRPVLKIAELPVTASTTTAGIDVLRKEVLRREGSSMGHSDKAGIDMKVPSEAYKEESYVVTPSPTPTRTPKAAPTTPITATTTSTTSPSITTKSTQTTPHQATSRATTIRPPDSAEFDTTQSSTRPTEEPAKAGDYKKEPWYKDGTYEPAYGMREDGLKQSGVPHSYKTYTLPSDQERKTSAAVGDSAVSPTSTTLPTSTVIPYVTPGSNNEAMSHKKSSEIFEINPAAEDLPGERDGTEIKDPRDRDVFHLPKTTISHTDSIQGVTVQYGHVAMPTMHEGGSRSFEMVYSVSEEKPEGNGQHRDSTTKRTSDKPSQKSRQSPEKDSPVQKDSPSERGSPYNWDSPSQKDSQVGKDSPSGGEYPIASHTQAPTGDSLSPLVKPGDSLKPLVIPGAMPPPGGWRKVEHKMLLGNMDGLREGLGEGLDETLVEGQDEGLDEGLHEGLGKGQREGVDESLEVAESEGMREHMTDSHLYEHIHPELAPSYEQIDGVEYGLASTEKVEPTVTATTTNTYTKAHTITTRNYDLGGKAESTMGDNRGSYSTSEVDESGHTSTLPLTTPTTPPIITIDMGTYHLNSEKSMERDDTLELGNVKEGISALPTGGHTGIAPTNTNPSTQTTETTTHVSGFSNSDRKVNGSQGSSNMSATHLSSPRTLRYDTTSTIMMENDTVIIPTSERGSTQGGPDSNDGVNRTVNVVYVDDVQYGNGSKAGVEGLTTDNIPVTTTNVSRKAEGVSVGLIVGVSFVVLLLFAIGMLPLIFCIIYKKDRKRINDNYMDRTDITTLASYGVNDRNYHSTTTLASVGSTRPLIRTPSWINKMLLFKKLNRKSVSDHCLVNMYHERQHPSTEDLYGSHGNQSCHLATKYASLSTERAASRKKRKSRESSSRMDDVISDFADESVFYLKRPKVKTKHQSPSVV